MDYTNVLNAIDTKLGIIIGILEDMNTDVLLNFMVILFCIFLIFYVMRGE